MSYLKKVNIDVHSALTTIRSKKTGTIENDVCPKLPAALWRQYDIIASNICPTDECRMTKMLEKKSTTEIFSNPESKNLFLQQQGGIFLTSLFGEDGSVFIPYPLERSTTKEDIKKRVIAVIKKGADVIKSYSGKFNIDIPIVIEVIFIDETDYIPVGQEVSQDAPPAVSNDIKNFFGYIFRKFQDDRFFLLPNFLLGGKRFRGQEHSRHSMFGNFDTKLDQLNICSWGVCSKFLSKLTPMQNNAARQFLAKENGYNLFRISFVLVPKSWH